MTNPTKTPTSSEIAALIASTLHQAVTADTFDVTAFGTTVAAPAQAVANRRARRARDARNQRSQQQAQAAVQRDPDAGDRVTYTSKAGRTAEYEVVRRSNNGPTHSRKLRLRSLDGELLFWALATRCQLVQPTRRCLDCGEAHMDEQGAGIKVGPDGLCFCCDEDRKAKDASKAALVQQPEPEPEPCAEGDHSWVDGDPENGPCAPYCEHCYQDMGPSHPEDQGSTDAPTDAPYNPNGLMAAVVQAVARGAQWATLPDIEAWLLESHNLEPALAIAMVGEAQEPHHKLICCDADGDGQPTYYLTEAGLALATTFGWHVASRNTAPEANPESDMDTPILIDMRANEAVTWIKANCTTYSQVLDLRQQEANGKERKTVLRALGAVETEMKAEDAHLEAAEQDAEQADAPLVDPMPLKVNDPNPPKDNFDVCPDALAFMLKPDLNQAASKGGMVANVTAGLNALIAYDPTEQQAMAKADVDPASLSEADASTAQLRAGMNQEARDAADKAAEAFTPTGGQATQANPGSFEGALALAVKAVRKATTVPTMAACKDAADQAQVLLQGEPSKADLRVALSLLAQMVLAVPGTRAQVLLAEKKAATPRKAATPKASKAKKEQTELLSLPVGALFTRNGRDIHMVVAQAEKVTTSMFLSGDEMLKRTWRACAGKPVSASLVSRDSVHPDGLIALDGCLPS